MRRRERLRTTRWTLAVCALGFGVLLPSCDATFDLRARAAYDEGRYLDAAERLERFESEVPSLPSPRRARYGLYRGLALLELGELQGARRWLEYVEGDLRLVAALRQDERRRLAVGLEAVRGGPATSGVGLGSAGSRPSAAAPAKP